MLGLIAIVAPLTIAIAAGIGGVIGHIFWRRGVLTLAIGALSGALVYMLWTWDLHTMNSRIESLCRSDRGQMIRMAADVTGVILTHDLKTLDPTVLTQMTQRYKIVASPGNKNQGEAADYMVWVRSAHGSYGERSGVFFERVPLQSIVQPPAYELDVLGGKEVFTTNRFSIWSSILVVRNRLTQAEMARIGLYHGAAKGDDLWQYLRAFLHSDSRCLISERVEFISTVLKPKKRLP